MATGHRHTTPQKSQAELSRQDAGSTLTPFAEGWRDFESGFVFYQSTRPDAASRTCLTSSSWKTRKGPMHHR